MQNNEVNTYYSVSDEEIFDTPIDYMRLMKSDFSGYNVTEAPVDIPEGKYLTETIINTHIHPHISDTTVINSSVGDGKTFLAIEMTRRYLTSDKGHYCVIFVAPHKSLVTQYKKDFYTVFSPIFRGFKIPDYEHLTEEDYDEDLPKNNTKEAKSPNNINFNCRFPLHVITINCLLGNAGDAPEQSPIKRKYIENIISFAQKAKGKIVLIMDELHDSIDNFRPELIPNLWRFKTSGVLHKIFTLSATYNEASKVVVKLLADLTDKNLHIIESNRKQLPDNNISNLHIHITEQQHYDFKRQEFIQLFNKIIGKHDHVDILSYSVGLTTDKIAINNSPIRSIFNEESKALNLCLAKQQYEQLTKKDYLPASFKSEYLETHNNTGTMFKTGISIKNKSNNAYVVILPSRWSMNRGIIRNSKGIFSDGAIDLVQALARVREKADIYLIMPQPNALIIPRFIDYNSQYYNYLTLLPELDVLQNLKSVTQTIINMKENMGDSYVSVYDELDSNNQKDLLKAIYYRIHNKIHNETTLAAQISHNQYPELDDFILHKGQKVISNYYAIFGQDLSAYAIWAAFNNQFVNCKIKTISFPNTSDDAISEEDTIQDVFLSLFMDYYSDRQEDIMVCDYQLYQDFYKALLSYKNYLKPKIQVRDSNDKLHRLLMAFIQKSLKGNERLNEKYHIEIDNHIQDNPFKAEDYLMCCIANALLYNGEELSDGLTIGLINAYKKLNEIRLFFINDLVMLHPRDNRQYLYQDYTKYNTLLDIEQVKEVIHYIHQNDNNFKHLEALQRIDYSTLKASKSVYSLLVRTFFIITSTEKRQKELAEVARSKGHNTTRPYIDYITAEIPLPTERTGINLLYKYDYMKDDNYENEILKMMEINESHDSNLDNILDAPISENDEDLNTKMKEFVDNLNKEKSEEQP